jgi:Zn2+/Cd2+-exporting ATPase
LKELFKRRKFKWLIVALAFSIALLILSFIKIELPLWVGLPIALLIIILVGRKIFLSGIKGLVRLKFSNINLLLTIATIGALYLRQFEEAVIIVVLFTIGENLEGFGVERSQKALKDLISKNPKTANIKGAKQKIPIEDIRVGQTFIVKPGDIIPLDGKVAYGHSLVDESTITGEPLPKTKYMNDFVYAGTKNGDGYMEVVVSKEAKDTTLSKIVALTYKAAQKKSSSQRFIEKFSKIYTPIVMAAAVLIVIIPVLIFQGSFTHWFTQALTLLIISCPCALVISTPVAVFSALGNATRNGVLIKGGRYLEDLGKIKAIAFDKTKTLTRGEPAVSDIITFGPYQQKDVLACAAGLEKFSEHPIAKSLIDKAKELQLDVHEFKDFKSVIGKGVKGQCLVCSDSAHFLGSFNFICEQQENIADKKVMGKINEFEKQGKTVVLMSENKTIKGIIAITDQLREEAIKIVKSLKKLKIKLYILSGDTLPSASFIGASVGIDTVKAGLLPDEKVKEIKKLMEKYQYVAMIGDGVNDAPALASASIGISMGSVGSDVAIENSDIALLNDNLEMIPYMVKLGRKSSKIIRFNIISAIIIKFAILVLAIFGQGNLLLAIFADVGVTIFVIINALRLFAFKENNPSRDLLK